MMLSAVVCTVFFLFFTQNEVIAQDKVPTTEAAGQYVGTNELEGLRYHLYSKLAESKKEIDSLRTDLNYWQNETLFIIKKYLINKKEPRAYESSEINRKLQDIEYQLIFGRVCNNTEDIIDQVREVMDSYKRAQSQELREIISEMSSGRLPLGTFLNPAPSCKHLPHNSSNGDYWIQNPGIGYASLVYCDMTRKCCDSSRGWMRVAHLDMTDHTHHCPKEFRKISSPRRTCGRPGSGCHSTTYAVNGISYSRVCGRIKAYQYYTTEAFNSYYSNRALTIDSTYVDGVSLTHGQHPRKHVWTFASAFDEIRSNQYVCPCTKTDTRFTGVVPPFIGEDYFCDSGSRYANQNLFYNEDPLWDGEGCGRISTCCQYNNPPWFCKQLPESTSDDIELRLCADSAYSNEDIAIEQVELYIQ